MFIKLHYTPLQRKAFHLKPTDHIIRKLRQLTVMGLQSVSGLIMACYSAERTIYLVYVMKNYQTSNLNDYY